MGAQLRSSPRHRSKQPSRRHHHRSRPAEICVGEVATGKVFSCSGEADIHDALACMQHNHVRRLIVTDSTVGVEGILSIDDVILNVQWSDHKGVALSFADVIRVLRKITYAVRPSVPPAHTRSKCNNCQKCRMNAKVVVGLGASLQESAQAAPGGSQ